MADPLQPNPNNLVPGEATNWADPAAFILDQQQRAGATAIGALKDNPDDAARAVELGKATGVPAPIIHGNLDNFEEQHKAALTAELLRNNQFLSQYANSDPMAARVSNDDWGQLDKVSDSLNKLTGVPAIRQIFNAPEKLPSILGAAAAGFKEGLEGAGPLGEMTSDIADKYGLLPLPRAELAAIGYPLELTSHIFSGILGAIHKGTTQAQVAFGSDQGAAERRSNEITAMAEAELMGLSGHHPVGEPAIEAAKQVISQKVVEAAKVAKPYLDQGREPPVGISSIIDQIHAEQARTDIGNLDEILAEAQKSATRERSPDLFANFVRQHTDARIGIDAEAVRKLYGDKEPLPEDGKLGWIEDLPEQLRLAEAHGGDVEVPLADWVAKVEPEIAKELHDNIRVRPGGMTLEETKEEKPEEEQKVAEEQPEGATPAAAPEITPVDSIRRAAKLDGPAFAALTENPAGSRELGIIPSSAKPDNEVVGIPSGEPFSPHLNFPLRDALKQVSLDHLTGIPRVMHEFYHDQLEKVVGDTPIRVVDNAEMHRVTRSIFKHGDNQTIPAFYSPGLHEIFINARTAEGERGHAAATYAIIHEGAHAVTARAMEMYPELKEKVSLMMKETMEEIKATEPELLEDPGHAYAFTNEHEFWSQAWSDKEFQKTLSLIPMSEDLAKAIGLREAKGKNIFDAFRRIIRMMMEKMFPGTPIPETMVDGLFHLQQEFEDRQGAIGKGKALGARPEEPELPGITRVEDRDLFTKAATIGMTKDQYAKYISLIEKRNAEDAAHHAEQAKAMEAERQTKEWKENLVRIRGEVAQDVRSRPDIAADLMLREGELHGEKVGKVRLAKDEVPPELAGKLPPDYLGATGIHPDDLAGLFGYSSGDELVRQLGRLEDERKLEGLTPAAHLSKVIDAETERQMRKTYGNLEQNILEGAKDHVISQTQLDMLHEEMLALGSKAGGELSISKDDLKDWVKQEFNRQRLGGHSSDKYLTSAGRAGLAAEKALLEDDGKEAFKAKQQQYISILLANEAKKLEKQREQFDKLAKRFSRREPSGVPPEYTNWVHDILIRTGHMVRRSMQDLQDAIGREQHDSLEKFVSAKNTDARIWEEDPNHPSDFQVMPVAPFLQDPAYRKAIDDMTPEEFRAVSNSVKTIIKNGQEERKINVKGEKEDLAGVLGRMTGQLDSLFKGKGKQYAFGHKDQGVGHAIRTGWAALLQIESIFNRFDRGDPDGIFQRVVTQPNLAAANDLAAREKRYARMYKALPDFGDLKRKVDNPIFGDPLQNWEVKKDFTRGNLLAVLQNVGNPGQLDKLARGYRVEDKNAIMQWLFSHTTKEDWDRAQALGDIFEKAFEESATMYHSLSGVAPEKIDIRPIDTPFGTYKGWYHPIIYDPLRPGTSKKLMGPQAMEDGSYYRAVTPSGYTKKRTGYAAPILLSFEAIPFRLRAILNDTAMRPTVTESAKVFYDPKWQMAITKYYGKEIKDLMIPYLKDIAGQKQYKDATQVTANRILETARQNVIATLIGLNPSTVMKHGPTAAMLSVKEVGAGPFLRELTGLLSHSDELGERNWTFAMKGGLVDGKAWTGSEELQRRQRNWQETLTGAQADVFGENTLRNTVIKLGATPVAISDLLSAVPTWLAAYKEQIRQGEEHGDAVAFADRAVRRAHGSSAVAARPRVMRGGALAQFATPFYTFFNEMFQRQYEMAWRAKDALGQFSDGEYKAGLAEVPNLAKGLWAYVLFPALVEQMVSPVLTGNESTAEKLTGWGARTVASGIPILRDMVEAFIGGRDPTVGLYSTGMKMVYDMARDFRKGQVALNRAHAGVTLKHTITAFGAASGLTNAQEGRTAEYVYNYATGQERPRDISDILRGLWHGTQKEPKR